MIFPSDAKFREERKRFDFRFCCEDCVFFNPAQERCSHDYPTKKHRLARYEDESAEIHFCKEFSLS